MAGIPERLHQLAEVGRTSEVQFGTRLRERGFNGAAVTQCNSIESLLKLMYQWHLNPQEDFRVDLMTHEHPIAGMIAGKYLASGEKSVAIFQNSGLPNAGDGFISFAENYGVPLLAIATYRGLGELSYPHQSIARRTVSLARSLVGRKHVYGSALGVDILGSLDRAADAVINEGGDSGQAILLLPKGAIRDTLPKTPPNKTDIGYKRVDPELKARKGTLEEDYLEREVVSRDEALMEIMQRHPNSLIIFCNGFTARAALQVKDRPGNFYNAAYMGGGVAIGYGAAISNPGLDVVVADGDQNRQMGSAMNAILAKHYPDNLHIYTLNNGGASSVGAAIPSVDLSYWDYDLTHVIPTQVDDLTNFEHSRVEDGVKNLFNEEDAEVLRQELGELKYITKRTRRWVIQEGTDLAQPDSDILERLGLTGQFS